MKLSLRAQNVPRVLFGMAPPVCSRCRSCELAFLSDDLRRMWAAERGLAWDWKDDLGYWRLCQACHRKVWPDDRRNRNGSSMPWSQLVAQRPGATKLVNGKAVLVNGDFYLTRPPPELLGTLGWWAQPLVPPVLQPVPLPPTFLGEPRPQTADQPSGPLGWSHAQSHRGLWGVAVQAYTGRLAVWSGRLA